MFFFEDKCLVDRERKSRDERQKVQDEHESDGLKDLKDLMRERNMALKKENMTDLVFRPISRQGEKTSGGGPRPGIEAELEHGRVDALLVQSQEQGELCLVFSVGLRLLEHLGCEVGSECRRWLRFRVQWVLAKSSYFVSDEGSLGGKETDKR